MLSLFHYYGTSGGKETKKLVVSSRGRIRLWDSGRELQKRGRNGDSKKGASFLMNLQQYRMGD